MAVPKKKSSNVKLKYSIKKKRIFKKSNKWKDIM